MAGAGAILKGSPVMFGARAWKTQNNWGSWNIPPSIHHPFTFPPTDLSIYMCLSIHLSTLYTYIFLIYPSVYPIYIYLIHLSTFPYISEWSLQHRGT